MSKKVFDVSFTTSESIPCSSDFKKEKHSVQIEAKNRFEAQKIASRQLVEDYGYSAELNNIEENKNATKRLEKVSADKANYGDNKTKGDGNGDVGSVMGIVSFVGALIGIVACVNAAKDGSVWPAIIWGIVGFVCIIILMLLIARIVQQVREAINGGSRNVRRRRDKSEDKASLNTFNSTEKEPDEKE